MVEVGHIGGDSDPGGKYRQGRGPREHRKQAGGAPLGILTAAVQPRPETESRRCTADFPLPRGILHGGAACCTAMGILTPSPPSCSWRFRPPGTGWRVCLADPEIRDGCYCARRTPSTPPAPFGAGFLVEGCFPLGWRAAFWRSPASPVGNPE
ncbi:hypothetical protein NDU88_005427 [Pleurodeles waltl]|uniref:Uncharacterized protein n=1 Tax=Pleurodeles waltl TaxID=8319 RepID=A0AAV7LL50_PLEWA|nr:hypothetical protein NDU88_005427 [Pleurodeles waltl]